MYKKWTIHEITYLKKHIHRIPQKQIAIKLNRTYYSVKMKATQLGLIIEKPKWVSYEEKKLKKLIHRYSDYGKIATILKRSRKSVYSKAMRMGLKITN